MQKKAVIRINRVAFIVLSILCLITAAVFMRRFVMEDTDYHYEKPSDYLTKVNHRVVLLCSYNPQYFTYDDQIAGFNESLCENGVAYDVFFMDGKNYTTEKDRVDFDRFFRERMASSKKYDGVIACDDDAITYICSCKDELFPDTPVVFIGSNDIDLATKAADLEGVTGFYENTYLSENIDIAIELMPERKTFVGFYDDSYAGRMDKAEFEEAAKEHTDYTFIGYDTSEYSIDELIGIVEGISDDSVLVYMTCYRDKDNVNHTTYELTSIFREHTGVPIIRTYDAGVGDGVLYSIGMSFEGQARDAGLLMCSILEGEDVDSYPLDLVTERNFDADFELMKKYGIDTQKLPADVHVYNRPMTFWDRYGRIVPSVGLIFLSLIFLILGIDAILYEEKRVNKELVESKNALEESHQKLQYQADHDEFLDILNRRSAVEYLRDRATGNDPLSVIMVDIDNFKDVNDTYGHQIADEILKYLSFELEKMSEEKGWMLFRYGGDEFLIVIMDKIVSEDSEDVYGIMDIFRKAIPIGEEAVVMSCSMGIAVPDGATFADQYIINAEIAMYEAKQRGRNRAFVYSDEMKKKIRDVNKIKAKILEAFDNDGFYMLYQPQIDLNTGKVYGYEALVRMKTEGMYPGVFIPVAESSGLITRIGRLTTEFAVKQLATWKEQGHELKPISVNYSSNQINDVEYVDFLRSLLEKYDIEPRFIEIEVTEGLFLEKTEQADKLFEDLRSLGIKLLMDDFGTGYSSLGYLTYIPVDFVKLDKSLVDTYLVEGKDHFIRDMIQLMHDLDKKLIIEGVEERKQYERLKEFGGDIIQGYYFSKPISADEAITFTVEDKL